MATNEPTKQKISNALFELLKSNDLDSISVSNICKAASVSRMSYYRSFKNKSDIIDYQLEKIFQDFFNYLMIKPSHDVMAFLDAFFVICRRNSKYIVILNQSNQSDLLYNKLEFYLGDLIDKGIFKVRTEMPEMWVSFAAGGLHQMINTWVKDDLRQTNQELVMVAHRFLK